MTATNIEWTESVWNPTRGCSVFSPGCANCYAMRQAHRFSGAGAPYDGLTRVGTNGPEWTGRVRLAPVETLEEPLHWRKGRRIFVDSMSDLFHGGVSNEQIAAIFAVMAACPQHTFQILTKRATRLRKWFEWVQKREAQGRSLFPDDTPAWRIQQMLTVEARKLGVKVTNDGKMEWPLRNVWLGVSVENQATADQRIPHLLHTPAAVRFLSCEPLLESVDITRWIEVQSFCGGCGETCSGSPRLCPSCRTDNLVTCWGQDQLERAQSGARYDGSPLNDGPGLHWVIIGGESGPKARPFGIKWARELVKQCRDNELPAFVKQLGANPSWVMETIPTSLIPAKELVGGRKGSDMKLWPEELRVREWPTTASA